MFKLDGLSNLEKVLGELGKQAGLKALTGAMRDAARPIVKETRRSFPKKSGDTAKAIRTEVFKGKGITDSVATLQIGYDKNKGYKGRFIERGTKAHRVPNKTIGRGKNKKGNKGKVSFGGKVFSNVRHPGIRATPILEPAFSRSYNKTIPIFKKRLRERIIIEAIKKYGKSA